MPDYPHMCRMDHEEIGHSDSNNERCPVCRREDDLTAAQARVEELERMVVWAVQKRARMDGDHDLLFGSMGEQPCDGTPASILAAVEKAMGEK